jgi:hypothetical protein
LRRGRRYRQHADADPRAGTDPRAYAHTDADTYSNTHANADTHADTHDNADTYPHADSVVLRYGGISRDGRCRVGQRAGRLQ